jgi:hypothetical protein
MTKRQLRREGCRPDEKDGRVCGGFTEANWALARGALTTSNAEFLRFRARECNFASALAGGSIGTAHEHWRLACVYELNIRRPASLDGFVADLPQRGS